jgi:Spy/CpxP family protein refolding chaperone
MKSKVLIIAAIAALAVGITAFAQRGGPGGFPALQNGAPTQIDPLAAVQTALGLSAAQVESARTLLTQRATNSQPVLEEIRTKQEALRTLQRSGTATAAELGAALAAVQAAQSKLEAIHTKFVADFNNLLTTDQKKIVSDTQAAAERIGALSRIGLIEGGPGFSGGRGGPGPRGPR